MYESVITVLASSVPDIKPNYDAPFFKAFMQIVSWVLGAGLLASFVALILCIAAIGFKSVFPEKVRSLAVSAIGWVFFAVAALGSISGIFQWLVGFDLGF